MFILHFTEHDENQALTSREPKLGTSKVSSSSQIEVGLEAIQGLLEIILYETLLQHLHEGDIFFLNQISIAHLHFNIFHSWIKADELGFTGLYQPKESITIFQLVLASISLTEQDDKLIWDE